MAISGFGNMSDFNEMKERDIRMCGSLSQSVAEPGLDPGGRTKRHLETLVDRGFI